ncbi:uncharacterized protein [Anoplolepis gracilipes]|uniref:uncharacterized protein n=1 Tax=Anoplolepis gracilipes TaxID=354296 RepID=UPI003BA074D2
MPAQEIEIDQFKDLTEEDLKVLIPQIGPRRKFQKNLKSYLDGDKIIQQCIKNVDTSNISVKKRRIDVQEQHSNEDNKINKYSNIENGAGNISPSISLPSTSTSDLESILKKSEEGQLLLSIYKNEKKLNNDLRNKLAKIIVSNELSPNVTNTITSERAFFLSDNVKKLFPTEDKSVWYIKTKKDEAQGRGKILTKYYCTRQKLTKAGLLKEKSNTDFARVEIDSKLYDSK